MLRSDVASGLGHDTVHRQISPPTFRLAFAHRGPISDTLVVSALPLLYGLAFSGHCAPPIAARGTEAIVDVVQGPGAARKYCSRHSSCHLPLSAWLVVRFDLARPC